MKKQFLIALLVAPVALFAAGAPTINPNQAAVTVQGWPNFDGRYTNLKYLKIEYAAPEPGMIALLALMGLAFLRRK